MFKQTKISQAAALGLSGVVTFAAAPVFAQDTQRIEITGSSIKRIEAETALPVQIITKDEIAKSGVISTDQLLQSISAISSQGGTNTAMGTGLSLFGGTSISLRGLGADRTLVLVNGRRLASHPGGNGAAIDINAIPVAAIERVEVLKDGASGVYGSDAIGGVVNFILTKNFQGIDLGATLGAPTRSGGGGKSTRATLVAGFGDLNTQRFNVTVSAALEKETALFGRDRDFSKTGTIPGYFTSGATGQGNIEGGYNPSNGTTPYTAAAENTVGNTPGRQAGFGNSPGSGYGNPLAATNNCGAISMNLNPTPTSKGAPFCNFDSAPFANVVPKRELTSLSANFVFKLTDSAELFGDALYSESVVTQTFQPNPVRRSFLVTDDLFAQTGVNPVLLIRPTNPNYSIASNYLAAQEAANPGKGFGALIGQPLAVTARVFDFGPRTTEDTSTAERLLAGVRGNFLKQDYELALVANRSKVSGKTLAGFFSQAGFSRVVNDPASDYNPWSLTQSAAFNSALAASGAGYVGPTLEAESKNTALEGKLAGDVVELPAGPLQYAAGLQSRKEDMVLDPSPAYNAGDVAGFGGAFPPVNHSRKINSLFGELNAPLLKGLEANLAVRNDHYDDVGNATKYKASLRWQPTRQVLLRGSVGTGFRAPTLIDLWNPVTLGASEQFNDNGPGGTGQTDLQVNSFTGGNTKLKPEESRQSTIGFVLQPVQDLTVTVDYWKVRVTDIIASPSAQEVVSRFRAGDPAFASLVTLTPGTNDIETITQTLQNVGSAKVEGVDVEGAYRFNFGSARLDLNLSGTYMIKFEQTSPGGSLSRKVGTIVEPDGSTPVLSTGAVRGSVNSDGVVLRWKHNLSATWTQGPWAFTLAQNFYTGYRDANDLNDNPHFVPAQALYDAQVAYTGVKNLKLAIGARNIFDKDPPLFIGVSNAFQKGYDITNYDPRARFVYFTANYKF